MSAELAQLYSKRLLALAADIPHLGVLDAFDGEARVRAPLCGSVVSVTLTVADGRIASFAQDVKACALGQASASVLGGVVIGRSLDELKVARTQYLAFLREDGPVPSAPFDGFEALTPARDYHNRHASILLALDATIAAVEQATAAH